MLIDPETEAKMALHPPIPVADQLSAPFWAGVRAGKLVLQRCADCQQLQFPPDATCESCSSTTLVFEEVSGRGTVHSYSLTVSGARHPYFQSITPYMIGHVELEEQPGLLMCSNFPGAAFEDIYVGAPVEVEFQTIAPGAIIPQFRLTGTRES